MKLVQAHATLISDSSIAATGKQVMRSVLCVFVCARERENIAVMCNNTLKIFKAGGQKKKNIGLKDEGRGDEEEEEGPL